MKIMNKIESIFCVVIGACMVVMWAFFLISGTVTELQTEPVRITLHILSELATALLLLIGGIAALKATAWSRPCILASEGMLIYSVINAAGYYAQQGNMAMIMMFAIIFTCATFFAVIAVLQTRKHNNDAVSVNAPASRTSQHP